jgi:hypothetical protein
MDRVVKAEIAGFLKYPVRPPSEFEWEDLLVRVETMPRVLRITVEEASADDPRVRALVDELAARESRAGFLLEDAAARAEGSGGSGSRAGFLPAVEEDGVRRFERLRTRNFAMVQRRGIEVWEWRLETGDHTRPTVYQLLAYLAEGDIESLAKIRAATRGTDAC